MESYLHKLAKEKLFYEINTKGIFEFKIRNGGGEETLISRPDYRHECILMEFPSCNGLYPDEVACVHTKECPIKATQGKRFDIGNGICKCSKCDHLQKAEVVIHDIAAFWKGSVIFAIEVVHRHPPEWLSGKRNPINYNHPISLHYPIYLVRALDVLKRVEETPVYVFDRLDGVW